MKYKELEEWADSRGYHVYKFDDTIKWMWKQNGLIEGSGSIQAVALQIFNHISDYKWVEYQKEYAIEQSKKDIYIEPPV